MESDSTILWDGRELHHHPAPLCKGQHCPLHNPSDHEYKDWGLDWNESWGVMVRRKVNYPKVGDVTMVIDPDEWKIQTLVPGDTLILENSAKCLGCGDHIVSEYRWDFETCTCGRVSVDGGKDYLKRLFAGDDGPGYEDTSITFTKEA